MSKAPFFILGCVRSGTTMLRDLLRMHPNLESPEETHFFRWADPFKTPRYLHPYKNNKDLARQREMDGISENEFSDILQRSATKAELAINYGEAFLKKRGNPGGRWFDKTPQNIYGILLISSQIPDAKFIHIVRNPLNVVTSLFEGKVVAISDLYGATNYWIESAQIMTEYQQLHPGRVLEVSYEAFTENPQTEIDRMLKYLGEDPSIKIPANLVHSERNLYRKVLTREQISKVIELCSPFYEKYGYGIPKNPQGTFR